jgi:hypothetical protein
MKLLPAVGVLMIGTLLSAAARADNLKIDELEYGIFSKPTRELEPGERLLTSDTAHVTRTTEIPAKLGVKFGISYKLREESYSGQKPQVKLLYLTPGILDANTGKRLDKIEIAQELSAESPRHLMAFEFTDKAELTPGEWHFYIFDEDRKLAEQTFNVVTDGR